MKNKSNEAVNLSTIEESPLHSCRETENKEESELELQPIIKPVKSIFDMKIYLLDNIDKPFQILMCTQYFSLGMRAMNNLALQVLFAKYLKVDPSHTQ